VTTPRRCPRRDAADDGGDVGGRRAFYGPRPAVVAQERLGTMTAFPVVPAACAACAGVRSGDSARRWRGPPGGEQLHLAGRGRGAGGALRPTCGAVGRDLPPIGRRGDSSRQETGRALGALCDRGAADRGPPPRPGRRGLRKGPKRSALGGHGAAAAGGRAVAAPRALQQPAWEPYQPSAVHMPSRNCGPAALPQRGRARGGQHSRSDTAQSKVLPGPGLGVCRNVSGDESKSEYCTL